MRLVEGGGLRALLERERPLEPNRAVAICGQIAAALDTAHARGLVHRDVKPSNALLDENEHVYLADFGLSRRLTAEGIPGSCGLSIGTPAYVAPEQIRGEADGRADVYSLGCVLYECLTGEVPYPRDSELAMLWAHLEDDSPTPTEYPALAPVFAKALAKEPEERYATCGQLIVGSDHVTRVRLSRGARPPGRRPRRTNRLAQAASPPIARRVSPRPSSCQLPESPPTINPALLEASTMP
jgi:serine/threonine protein kinase